MKYITITVLFLLTLFSCEKSKIPTEPKKNERIITMNQITTNYDTLVNKVKLKGSIDAYDELFFSFMDSNEAERTDSMMVYSKIMAEKYNYQKAYLDYFKALCEKFNIYIDYPHYDKLDISKMPEDSKKQAKGWLNQMLEKKIITKEQYDAIKK
ncbi:hypothetical protein IW15_21495 [Chryseobacterium soli]|uniref:DUF4296 domain-containing protein n=1 Tax=Chryseobacterium soli TaxID=445961 RepID=A0A086A0A0_9FLAO|nr:hypothetical protein [Chryseobacterium soli]KFF10114.1 hypothetical protein IW15_21495 [Chryseobacterium soli]